MRTLSPAPGVRVEWNGDPYTITHVADLQSVVARCETSGIPKVLKISDLRLPDAGKAPTQIELGLITDKRWRNGQRRWEIVRDLYESGATSVSDIEAAARDSGTSKASIWRWLRRCKEAGGMIGLVDAESRGTKGRSLLQPEVEAIVRSCIDSVYLDPHQVDVTATYNEVRRRCRLAKLRPPAYSTVRRRIEGVPEMVQLRRRAHKKKARDRFEPRPDHFTEAEHPLDIIQIDHTELDVLIVDEEERLPIGRPWVTLGIDACTRCVWGVTISLDHPSANTTGLCISQGILGKEQYLKDLGIEADWPVWGIPRVIHVDNGREFRGYMLNRACQKYGIRLQFRPAYRPNYGPFIERFFGTMQRELHRIPGTTFSKPEDRGEYDSDAQACITLTELRAYVVRWITQEYHLRPHKGLRDEPPLRAYERCMLESSEIHLSLPQRVVDEEELKIDFMPLVERKITRTGVELHHVHYYDPVLQSYMQEDPSEGSPDYTFHYDPGDMSCIYFFDDVQGRYVPIPYRDIRRPPLTEGELRAATKKARERSRSEVDEDAIFEAHEANLRLVDEATRRTKAQRRAAATRKGRANKSVVTNRLDVAFDELEHASPFEDLEL